MRKPLAPVAGAALLVLAASAARVVVEWWRGVVHADSDLLSLFIPSFAWWWERPRWLGGWNPWVFGGHPANADPQIATPHPLGLAYALLDPLTAATIDGVLTPALGGVGMLVYLRCIGSGVAPALVGALSFALGGYFSGHATNPGLMRAALAVPWALAAIEALDGRKLVAGLGAAVGLLVLSGHPQSILYASVLVLAYAAFFARWWSGRRALALGVAGTLGLGVAAVLLLPAAELVSLSSRAFGEMSGHADPKLTGAALLGVLLPFPRGGAVGPLYGTSLQVSPGCGVIECSGYPGMLPWLVVLAALPLLLRSARGRFWLAAGVLGVVLATGVAGAGTSSLRAPVRFLLWWNVAVPVLAALALEGTALRPRLRACVATVLLVALALGATWLLDPPSRRVAVGSMVVLALAAAALLAARRSARPALLLVGFTLVELVAYMASLPFGVPYADYRRAMHATRFLADARPAEGAGDTEPGRSLVVPLLRFADWAPFSRTLLLQGYNSLLPARIAGLLDPSPGAPMFEIGWVDDPSLASPASHVLDLLRATVVAMPPATQAPLPLVRALHDAAREGTRFAPLEAPAANGLGLLVNHRARPLAWVVHRTRVAGAAEARALVRDDAARSFDPAVEALVESAQASLPPAESARALRGSVRLVSFDDDEIRLVAETAAPGLLVTSELDYPGWTATVDGVPAEVATVNAGFRAVPLAEAGRHEVVLAYRPWRSRVGLALSLASALVLLALAVVPRGGR